MLKAADGNYALWFLIILAAGKIIAASLTIGIGGIRRRVRSLAVHRRHLRHGIRRDSEPPARPGGRAASPVRGHRDGRRVRLGVTSPADLARQRGGDDRRLHPHRPGHARRRRGHCPLPHADLRHDLHHQAAAPRHRHRPPLLRGPVREPHRRRCDAPLQLTAPAAPQQLAQKTAQTRRRCPGRVTRQREPQPLLATESLAHAMRQLVLYGRDGLPVLSPDGKHLLGWITSQNAIQAITRQIPPPQTAAQAPPAAQRAAPAGKPPSASRTLSAATRYWKSPSPATLPSPARRSAMLPGHTGASRSPSWTVRPCETPNPASSSAPATGSTCSPANHTTRNQDSPTTSPPASQTAKTRNRGQPCEKPGPRIRRASRGPREAAALENLPPDPSSGAAARCRLPGVCAAAQPRKTCAAHAGAHLKGRRSNGSRRALTGTARCHLPRPYSQGRRLFRRVSSGTTQGPGKALPACVWLPGRLWDVPLRHCIQPWVPVRLGCGAPGSLVGSASAVTVPEEHRRDRCRAVCRTGRADSRGGSGRGAV